MTTGFSLFVKSLAANTARLNSGNPSSVGKLTLVLGNESADLDSMVSSISLAYTLTQPGEIPAIPVINTNRTDMALRPDCNFLLSTTLQTSGASIQDLTFIDDFDLPSVIRHYEAAENYVVPGELEIWLADHNAPASRQRYLEPFVKGIVDHHVDEGRCLMAKTRIIDMVGSCTSLVGEMIRDKEEHIDPVLAKMILAPILLDTADLSPAAMKATDKDRACVSWLFPQVQWAEMSASSNNKDTDEILTLDVQNTTELFKTLDKLKGQVSHLSSRDLLRKDYKQWQVVDLSGSTWNVGISSVGYRLRKWIKRDGQAAIVDAVDRWIKEQGLDIALVMAHGKAKDKKHGVKVYGRDLVVVFSKDRKNRSQSIADGLAKSDLNLVPFVGTQDTEMIRFYSQLKTEASRKQVFPVVKQVIESDRQVNIDDEKVQYKD
ncbi:Exopolyphosphatase [Coemansia erecta]|uniref:Exopolyphosphatase n=1 Tax=Coemansia asiatica TaxID=1052880 RepID=A0A9W7XRG0_9FUNG|nr:Exopolyphosphatase [Coemansia asiatica]KAJ2858034.1 Exopolyphosphatase [Coemansia erecta]KAJ2883004.1 Exopolyphosphatase [Coemansia asiatica]